MYGINYQQIVYTLVVLICSRILIDKYLVKAGYA